jgi:NADH-ubiquinone oxidoreductase chain 2
MLVSALFIILTVVALPALNVSSITATRICSIVLASISVMSYNALASLTINSGISLYNELIQVTSTTYIIDILLGIIGSIALIAWAPVSIIRSRNYVSSSNTVFTLVPLNTYYGLLALFSVTGSSILVSSASLMCLYLSLEVQSFAVYVIAALYRNSETATDAGLTYFLLGGLSSCFILLGSAQIYASLGVTSLEQVYVLLSVGENTVTTIVAFSLTVLASGLCFKIAAAPFHQWAPDVYDRVPTIVSTWLQTMPKIAVLGLLIELTSGLTFASDAVQVSSPFGDINPWVDTLIIVAVVSLIIGSVIGLAQVRIKRLLTYSTISHVGFILLALTAYSTDSVASFFFYLAQYSITSLAVLIIVLAFGYVVRGVNPSNRPHTSDMELLSELTGQAKTQPILSLGFAFLLFSIAGVPPFVGFFAKQGVLEASLTANYGGLAVLAIVVSVVSASYYLKVVRLMQFNRNLSTSSVTVYQPLTSMHTFIVSTILIIVTLYILLPSSFLDSTRTLAEQYTIIN